MTAEIAILNQSAVALAADSAVTMSQGDDKKIFLSAEKIFALSKYHPIAIMVYGNASFMGIPWETIVKMYRNVLRGRGFQSVEKYALDFFAYLSTNEDLFPLERQQSFFAESLRGYYSFMLRGMTKSIEEVIQQKKKITKTEIRKEITRSVDRHYRIWSEAPTVPGISVGDIKRFKATNKNLIDDAVKAVFQKLPLSGRDLQRIHSIGVAFFAKNPDNLNAPHASGVVFAGFGSSEIYPSVSSYTLEAVFEKRLKYRSNRQSSISIESNAEIIPFAQSEMVSTFMEGVEPSYETAMERDLRTILFEYPDTIIDSIGCLTEDEKLKCKSTFREMSKSKFEHYQKKLQEYRLEKYVDPVLDVVGVLPKNELAAMAESLVNLTSFKRRVSFEAETVGGPIDVVVISKGDGLIWIKRKHYFTPDLNPRFLSNYYLESENGKEE